MDDRIMPSQILFSTEVAKTIPVEVRKDLIHDLKELSAKIDKVVDNEARDLLMSLDLTWESATGREVPAVVYSPIDDLSHQLEAMSERISKTVKILESLQGK